MPKGLDFERRVGRQMRLDHFYVASSHKLDQQKRDFVVIKNNAKVLPFPVDIQFTTRFNDLLKLSNFIKRQGSHPHRKRLYVRVHYPKDMPLEKMLVNTETIAHLIEDTVMAVQQRTEGIFILSIERDNRSELLSFSAFVAGLKEQGVNLPTPTNTRSTQWHPSPRPAREPPYQCEIIGKIDLSAARHFHRSIKKMRGQIERLTSDGFYIRGRNGNLYWSTYTSFVPRHRNLGGRLQRLFAIGRVTHLRRRIRRVLFELTTERHEWNGKYFTVVTQLEKLKK